MNRLNGLDYTAFALAIVGALNWLLVGLFRFDLVAAIFGGQDSMLSRIVYTLVGLAGVYAIYSLTKLSPATDRHRAMP
ncbi:MAG: DUF378 domain-containing protein [Armatimonadota bacterium]